MRPFTSVLVAATVAAVTSAQSGSSSTPSPLSSSTSESSPMPAELAAIVECSTIQLDEAQTLLTSNQRQKQCETALNLESNTMLQVTTASATEMCDTASCRAALLELYNVLPNCRYNLWGLQYSAKQLLEYCGITPTNTTDLSSSSGSVDWSVTSDSTGGSAGWHVTSSSDSFATAGSDTSSPVSSPTPASSAPEESAATTTATFSAVLATTVGLVTAFLA